MTFESREHQEYSELIKTEEKAEYDFLDTIDVLDYIQVAAMGDFEVWQVMEEIQKCEFEKYQKFLKENNISVTEGGEEEIFNCIDDYDFADYVEKRYPGKVRFREIVQTNLFFEITDNNPE